MAEREDTTQDGAGGEPQVCRPCRGTGTVISGLGGEQHTQPCPWCDGTGTRIPERDAQAAAAAARAGG
jgi:DnaJ-class molecular chaperone